MRIKPSSIHIYAPSNRRNKSYRDSLVPDAGPGLTARPVPGTGLRPRQHFDWYVGPKLVFDPPRVPSPQAPQSPTAARPSLTDSSPAGPFKTHATAAALRHAIADLPEIADMSELIDIAKDHVVDGLESAAGRKTVVLVGESHTSQAGAALLMAALSAVAEHDGDGNHSLMIEQPPSAVAQIRSFAERNIERRLPAADNDDAASELQELLSPGDARARASALAGAKVHLGTRLGFEVAGFDTAHGQALEAREQAMHASLRTQLLGRDGVVVAASGNAHLPALRESFGTHAHVISLARIDDGMPDRANAPWKLERFSYLLAHRQVLPLRTANSLEAAPFDYLALAEGLGIDMTRAAQA